MPPQNLQKYTKQPKTISDQISLLQSRGMEFDNIHEAEKHLSHINYYRLSAYWLPFEQNGQSHNFNAATNFNNIINHYIFDRELRLLILEAIERIEISVRTHMTQELTSTYNTSHPHLDPTIFFCPVKYGQNIIKLKGEFDRSKELFSYHFKNKYQDKLPPMWAAVELMTMGQISHWYSNIKARAVKNNISRSYGLDQSILSSFLHNLTIIRNITAHHARLWNRKLTFSIKTPNSPNALASSMNTNNGQKKMLYNTLVFLTYLIKQIEPINDWKQRIMDLITKHNINTNSMGFPQTWETLPIWN